MPNWTRNRIYAEGDQADIRAFLDAVRSQDQLFDFNRIIPMPELIKRTECGSRIIHGRKVSSWYVVREASFPDIPEETRLFTPEEEATLKDIGHSNWYEWSVANWGTKWNACEAALDNERPFNDGYVIRFDTAWDAPKPIFRKMIKLFPRLKFDCRWDYEFDCEYTHSLTSGQVTGEDSR